MTPSPSPEEVRRVAAAFAAALDRDDFVGAARFLATDSVYDVGGETRVGSVAILASYADSSTWGRQVFDEVGYESEVGEPEGDTVTVLYADHLAHGGRSHTYRCRQRLTVGEEGRVVRIEHEELPGEREGLERFFAECGVERGR